jgi:hypothetical protein
MVIGENIVPVNGYGRLGGDTGRSLLARVRRYCAEAPGRCRRRRGPAEHRGRRRRGVEPGLQRPGHSALLESGRLAFELKVGQGAKPGLGGMTVVDGDAAAAGRPVRPRPDLRWR